MTQNPPGASGAYKYYVLLILLLVNTVNFIDRQGISVLAGAFQAEFGISNTQLGAVMGIAFTVFYAFLGFPIARLADRWNRVGLLAAVLAIWSGMTALCGAAGNAIQLFLFRVGVGIGEAGAGPASHSIIADYFKKKDRPAAIGVFSVGVSLGTFLGITGGGLLVGELGWRWTFVALGAPGLVLMLLVLLTIREPLRGGTDDPADAAALRVKDDIKILDGVGRLWAIPTFRFMSIASALSALCGYGMNLWMPLFLTRIHELTPSEYALPLGFVQGLGGGLGAALGGIITARVAERSPGAFLLLPGLTMVFFAIALGAAVWSQSLAVVYPAVAVASFMQIYLMGPFFGLTQRLAPLRGRAVATAFIFFILSLTGLGIGPTYVGAMNDYFGRQFGDAEGLRLALTTLVAISTVAGVVAIAGYRYVGKDLGRLDNITPLGPTFSFRGRTTRIGLLGYTILGILAVGIVAFIAGSFALLFAPAGTTPSGLVVVVPQVLAALIGISLYIPAVVRRLNDIEWHAGLAILPFAANVALLYVVLLAPDTTLLFVAAAANAGLLLALLLPAGKAAANGGGATAARQPA